MSNNSGTRRTIIALMVGCLMLPQALWAQSVVDDKPNEWAMLGDLLVARPVGAVMTAGGTVLWVVSLPFTLLAGHAAEAGEVLIAGPAESTFMRCLGCTHPGYTYKDIERNREKAGSE